MGRRLAGLVCLFWCLGLGLAWPRDLYDYYLNKFPAEQNQLYDEAARQLFPAATGDDQRQAREEAEAVSYVVLHRTRYHEIANNVAVTHQWRGAIETACRKFDVPPAMALAILSWENSGGTQAMSFAACAGMGQMSAGATTASHLYATSRALPASLLYRFYRFVRMADESVRGGRSPARHGEQYWLAQSTLWQTQARHRRLARLAHVPDERMLPAANIEDSVLFMRTLLDAYDNRVGLAISAYHNGQANNDDLMRDYLRRMDPVHSSFTAYDRQPLLAALRERHIDYLTVWNDRRSREMLNGLRTMDGDVTTDANRREALGDESDIYLWKALAAYAAFLATPQQLAAIEERYQGPQEVAETRGWQPATPRIAPELAGYLGKLRDRLQTVAGRKALIGLAVSHTMAPGIATDVTSTVAPAALGALLNEDWLFDRIYLTHVGVGHWHICLNPRFGRDYLKTAGR